FALPRFRAGEFGGAFTLPVSIVPEVNTPPVDYPDGRFWIASLDTTNPQGSERMYQAPDESNPIQGVAAIYKVCTHLGCIYKWVPANSRFECPCHGSKYRLDGRRVEAPAPRTLDRFKLSALDDSDNVLASAKLDEATNFYRPLVLPAGATKIQVDTGGKNLGLSQTLLCSFVGNCL
ncbi:MAG: ubiquinol-cytochrome c reductase iron-sulfur subunit, partial [Candidatus Promineifilaceae bacterium]